MNTFELIEFSQKGRRDTTAEQCLANMSQAELRLVQRNIETDEKLDGGMPIESMSKVQEFFGVYAVA